MSGRTWTMDGRVWLAEFDSGAEAVDMIEGGWLDAQPELAEAGCMAVREGTQEYAEALRTGDLSQGIVTIGLVAEGTGLIVQLYAGPLEDIAEEHYDGIAKGVWGASSGRSELDDSWGEDVDIDPHERAREQGLEGIDDGGPGDLF